MFREDNYEIGGQFLWSNCSIHLVAGLTANQDENLKTGFTGCIGFERTRPRQVPSMQDYNY